MFLDLPQVLQGESYSVGLCARAPNNTSLCIIIFTVSMVTVNLLSLKGMLAFNSIMGPNSTTILKNILFSQSEVVLLSTCHNHNACEE